MTHRFTFALALLAAAPAVFAADAPRAPMSKAEAQKILDDEGIAALPDNIAGPILGGQARTVEALLVAGVDPDHHETPPQSGLELAAMSCARGGGVALADTLATIDALLAAHANPNTAGVGGLGPLMIAAQQCPAAVVKRLVAAGAKLDSRTPQGFTPLSMAFVVSNLDAAEALIDAGARLSPDAAKKLVGGADDSPQRLALIKRATGT